MSISISKSYKYFFCVALFAFILYLFLPRSYAIPDFKERASTNYWKLESGSKIGYTCLKRKGALAKAPIIYLHGGPGGLVKQSSIDLLLPLTVLGHDVYLYDQVGSGHSNQLENIEEYSVDRHRSDLEEIIEIIDAEKIILFGHSWGSMLAVEYYSSNPDKVQKMIFSGPGPILPFNRKVRMNLPPDSLHLIAPKFTNKEANEKVYTLRAKLIDKWAYIFGSKLATDKEVDAFFAMLNSELDKSTTCDGVEDSAVSCGLGYYAHIMTVKSFYSVREKREKIRDSQIPVLILKGQCDNQNWGYTEEYMKLFPNASLRIIKNAGHKIEASRQDEYIDNMIAFLE